ncbi:MAG TPA: D-amino-acid transaminase [Metalysinibacillus jejuensis]|uniref:D-alanine aminotransferase n=1 Tax=Metalysinibacillus jejuensis TaxID=914327 RepID=A0A921NB41_9BACL|nr:D-amino-acid transaminase [Metalysinibacillus jejuensis]
MNYVLYNDQIVTRDEVVISQEDRGYQLGDGVYEVVKVYDGKFFTAKEHIDRLYASADKIDLVIPYTKDVLHKLLHDLVEKNELGTGHVYFQVTRGVAPRNHIYPEPAVEAVLTANVTENPRPMANFENGVRVIVQEDIRWLRCDIKSISLLGAAMLKQKAHQAGCYEAILHRDGVVTECSSSNVLAIKDGVLYTHPATNLILNGITRQVILACADEIGLPVKEEAFRVEDIATMDELIVSSTTSEVTPIVEVDGVAVNGGTVGPWTRKLQQAFNAKVEAL